MPKLISINFLSNVLYNILTILLALIFSDKIDLISDTIHFCRILYNYVKIFNLYALEAVLGIIEPHKNITK